MLFSGPGLTPSLKGDASNQYSLAAGGVKLIGSGGHAGWYAVNLGLYTTLQQYDPIAQFWRTVGGGDISGSVKYFFSDGVNYRVANQTGCAVGALITNAGSGYTSAPVVTASAGSSLWRAIVGGAVNTTITVTNAGTGYTYAPLVVIQAPPPGGIQATAVAVLSGGTISS